MHLASLQSSHMYLPGCHRAGGAAVVRSGPSAAVATSRIMAIRKQLTIWGTLQSRHCHLLPIWALTGWRHGLWNIDLALRVSRQTVSWAWRS
jgi:hypothetical protein